MPSSQSAFACNTGSNGWVVGSGYITWVPRIVVLSPRFRMRLDEQGGGIYLGRLT